MDAPTPTMPFVVHVPSRSNPDHVHVITRHLDGAITHSRGCRGFEVRGSCWHVTRAVALTDHPSETFVADVIEAWGAGGMSDALKATYARDVVQAAQDARNRTEALARWRSRRMVDLSRTHDDRMADAMATFGAQLREAR